MTFIKQQETASTFIRAPTPLTSRADTRLPAPVPATGHFRTPTSYRQSNSKMNVSATRLFVSVVAILLTVGLTVAKSIAPPSEGDVYQRNQAEARDDLTLDNALLKYILAREVLNRQRAEDYQFQKRDYWKQCAFNAVSCFGKK